MLSHRSIAVASQPGESPPALNSADPALLLSTGYADDVRATVQVSGELDLSTTGRLAALLEEHLAAGRRYLRVDLGGCTFLDTAVLTTLVQLHRRLLNVRGTLVLTGVGRRAAKLLAVTGMDAVLFVGGPRSV